MPTLAIQDFAPVAAGAWGSGHPATDLPSFAAYSAYVSPFLPGYAEAGNVSQWATPVLIMPIDTQAGGIFYFQPAPGDEGEPFSAYEYQLQATGQAATAWASCPSFRLPIPNDEYLPGAVRVRHQAMAGRAASVVLTNRQAFTFYAYPLVVIEHHFVGSVLHVTLRLAQPDYVRIITNGYLQDFYQGQRPAGDSDFTFDFSGFEGSGQGIQFEDGSYRTPAFSVIVPNK